MDCLFVAEKEGLRECACVGVNGDGRALFVRERSGDLIGTLSRERGPVLIVDDNVEMAENIAEILELAGHVTDVAASAEEALRKALARNFDVLVTDFRLPGMNGVDLVRMMRRDRQQVVAIVISAFADEGTMLAAQDAGARFLEKPLDCTLLERLVRGPEGSA